MGVTITVNAPPDTSAYNQWRLYRSATKTGTYSIIATQAVTDLTYTDEDGSSTDWYKIDYLDTGTSKASALSAPLMGQSTAYTTLEKVRSFLQLHSITDSSNPNAQAIINLINKAEDEIDFRTGHAWRMRFSETAGGQDLVGDYEYHNFEYRHQYQTGTPIYLKHRKIRQLSAADGDALEWWNGATWENWLTTKTEGRNNDYWIDYHMGILYVRLYYANFKPVSFRLKYRYGETVVNGMIEDVATKMVAIDILSGMDSRTIIVPEGQSSSMTHDRRIDIWTKEINTKLHQHKEIRIPGYV